MKTECKECKKLDGCTIVKKYKDKSCYDIGKEYKKKKKRGD